ncbi:hypothetical protein COO60DRAFT_1487185 [Scenedesmus sp. NREL 46B-D3]|nr:hypothetical protein COO60DRAFT_1487185 [Scenedesmus sp. NREL 46B-D3]
MVRPALTLLLVVACAASATAIPTFWAARAPNCVALPQQGYARHKAPVDDKKSTISLFPAGTITASSKPLTKVCAGKTYAVRVKFPGSETRLAYLTASPVGGASARIATNNASNSKCANALAFAPPTGFTPSNSFSSRVTAPNAAGKWMVAVASATGSSANYQITRATFTVSKC